MKLLKLSGIILVALLIAGAMYQFANFKINLKKYPPVAPGCQRTFALIKPHAVAEKKTGKIITMIESAGFTIVALEKTMLSCDFIYRFYKNHTHYPWFAELARKMSASPVIAMVLEKENAVADWDSFKEEVRALYGVDHKNNVVHGSDSAAEAQREMRLFFGNVL